MRPAMPANVRAVSIFSVDKASGHSVYDDQFYFDLLQNSGVRFTFYAPPYSIGRLRSHKHSADAGLQAIHVDRPGWTAALRAARSIPVAAGDKVVFLGYSERFVVLFTLLNLLRRFDLVLVATNNISHRRVRIYNRRMRLFFRFLGSRLTRLVVHTDEEKRLCGLVNRKLPDKTVVKKHYLMIPHRSPGPKDGNSTPVISYFGPEKYYKPIQPVVDLIRADTSGRFTFRLFRVNKDQFNATYALPDDARVEFIDRRLSKDEYFNEYSESSFIIMTHDKGFEGKLSGNLCDCISTGVPFIGANIEPIPSFFARYGAIGCVYDFGDPDWPTRFLDDYSPELHTGLLQNLRAAQADYRRPVVEQDNINAILA